MRPGQDMPSESQSPDHSMQAAELKMREALGLGSRREIPVPRQQVEPQRPLGHRQMGDRPNATGHRHRFVQDGEVPVVMVSHANGGGIPAPQGRGGEIRSPNSRVAAMAADAGAERTARERAERALSQAQSVIREMETKLGHAEIARTEALASAKAARTAAATTRADFAAQIARLDIMLAEERAARGKAEHALQQILAAQNGTLPPPPIIVRRAYTRRQKPPETFAEEVSATPVKKTRKQRVVDGEKPARKRRVAEPKPVKWWVKSKTAAR
jgi:hypothetical protein